MNCCIYPVLDAFFAIGPVFWQQVLSSIALGIPWIHIITRAKNGSTITLNPQHLIFLSSRTQVFDPNDPNQMEIGPNNTDHILIHPERARNGLCTLIAYPNPDYHLDILLTARLPIEISIPGNTIAGGDKAIIVAGFSENQEIDDPVSEATNCITNHAYLSLRKKKLSRNDIFYFNRDHYQDVDRNKNDNDDIDGYPNWKNLNSIFQQIKKTGAEELLIVLKTVSGPPLP